MQPRILVTGAGGFIGGRLVAQSDAYPLLPDNGDDGERPFSSEVIEAELSGSREIESWGDDKQTRRFMDVDGRLEGTLRLTRSDANEPLDVGSSELFCINGLVSIDARIASQMGLTDLVAGTAAAR